MNPFFTRSQINAFAEDIESKLCSVDDTCNLENKYIQNVREWIDCLARSMDAHCKEEHVDSSEYVANHECDQESGCLEQVIPPDFDETWNEAVSLSREVASSVEGTTFEVPSVVLLMHVNKNVHSDVRQWSFMGVKSVGGPRLDRSNKNEVDCEGNVTQVIPSPKRRKRNCLQRENYTNSGCNGGEGTEYSQVIFGRYLMALKHSRYKKLMNNITELLHLHSLRMMKTRRQDIRFDDIPDLDWNFDGQQPPCENINHRGEIQKSEVFELRRIYRVMVIRHRRLSKPDVKRGMLVYLIERCEMEMACACTFLCYYQAAFHMQTKQPDREFHPTFFQGRTPLNEGAFHVGLDCFRNAIRENGFDLYHSVKHAVQSKFNRTDGFAIYIMAEYKNVVVLICGFENNPHCLPCMQVEFVKVGNTFLSKYAFIFQSDERRSVIERLVRLRFSKMTLQRPEEAGFIWLVAAFKESLLHVRTSLLGLSGVSIPLKTKVGV